MSLFSCAGNRPSNLGINDSKLSPCPDTPNCVSSDSTGSNDSISAIKIDSSKPDLWHSIREAVLELPRTIIVSETSDYLHAECKSAFFGFVDDLELHLRASENIIAIRSASRLGSSDFGVNRKRVEQLRNLIANKNLTQ